MQIEYSVRIEAPPPVCWDVQTDVERWPEWTDSVRKIERVDDGPFGLGSRARLWLRGSVGASEWRVTSFAPGESFTWESRPLPGFLSIADHEQRADGDGTIVALRIRMRGALSGVLAPYMRRVSHRNLQAEIAGLKRRCEELARG